MVCGNSDTSLFNLSLVLYKSYSDSLELSSYSRCCDYAIPSTLPGENLDGLEAIISILCSCVFNIPGEAILAVDFLGELIFIADFFN
jgi:hypothetical protein